MADKSKIEWTDASWTPIRAKRKASGKVGWHCTHATPGCAHCYAEDLNKRLGTGLPFKPGHAGEIELFLDEAMLLAPLRWKKPRMIFVCSMTDLFADFVPDEWIDKIFAVMALTPHHTYQVLTKRSARMRAYLTEADLRNRLAWDNTAKVITLWAPQWKNEAPDGPHRARAIQAFTVWPLPNVWLGVSAEDQRRAGERIPDLLASPAAIRFVSAEPLLGPIDFKRSWYFSEGRLRLAFPALDWIIVGGESGREARPMHPDWARQIRDQCAAAGTAFFFKQHGEWLPEDLPSEKAEDLELRNRYAAIGEQHFARFGKKRAGRLLDGVQHDGMPEVRLG